MLCWSLFPNISFFLLPFLCLWCRNAMLRRHRMKRDTMKRKNLSLGNSFVCNYVSLVWYCSSSLTLSKRCCSIDIEGIWYITCEGDYIEEYYLHNLGKPLCSATLLIEKFPYAHYSLACLAGVLLYLVYSNKRCLTLTTVS